MTTSVAEDRSWLGRLLLFVLFILLVPPLLLFITTPMDVSHQALLGAASVILMLVVNRLGRDSRRVSVWLALISLAVSTRYLYWRATETLVFQTGLEHVLGYGLFAAELYAWVILFFGYIQTMMPLERRIVPLPENTALWPSVDVYIPTYNEEMSVVMDTVLAAQSLEYPDDKLNIYLLDDGRRQEFAAFAARAGIGYITRDNNEHAKAGNLNNAMELTDGELICVFDCDHIPTVGFLQSTVGGFISDPRLSMLQTPHFFYSNDPFERNLAVGEGMPREGELFYGPVQKGNDFWNATFFCGSCAVIRRAALDEIGGFAVETVTEDAHTALKLQRRGWRTAYLGLPLAAGLATERLSLHIGQRARWARGMTQILRVDNPLFGRGLTWAQRLCYLNAMLHFQFPLPRVVFLTAPLAYLLAGQNIIASSAEMIFAYALPHLFHAIYTNSRLNGRFRHTFWGEIYESVLCFRLIKPTLMTLWNPRRGKFNVTEKGGLLRKTFFDVQPVKPHLIVAFLLIAGLGWGLVRLYWHEYYGVQPNVMLLNIFWAGFSLFTLLAAIAVARERRQVRGSVRVDLALPATLYLVDGHTLSTETVDISMTGVSLKNPVGDGFKGDPEDVELVLDNRRVVLPVELMGANRHFLRLRFGSFDVDRRRGLVRMVMGRADAWLDDGERRQDNPLRSFLAVARCIVALFFPNWLSRDEEEREANRAFHEGKMWRWIMPLAMLFLLAVLTLLAVRPALAQSEPPTSAQAAQAVPSSARHARDIRLQKLGFPDGMPLTGDGAQAGAGFSLPVDEVVTEAAIVLRLKHDPALAGGNGELLVMLNGEPVRRLTLEGGDGSVREYRFSVNPSYLVQHNRIDFRLFGVVDQTCPNPLDPRIQARIMPDSGLDLTSRRLRLSNRLERLPLPFFDPEASGPVTIHLAVPDKNDVDQVRAAAMVASWFGAQNRFRDLHFEVGPVAPHDHAVVLATNAHPAPGTATDVIAQPGLRLVDHPDGSGKMLLLEAPDSHGLIEAAQFLLGKADDLQGAAAPATALSLPVKEPYDSPRWLKQESPLQMGELVPPDTLRVDGIHPALIRIPFRVAPDLDLWPGRTVPLRVRYRFPDGDWLDTGKSRLDVALNGQHLGSLPVNRRGLVEHLWGMAGGAVRQEEAVVPVPPSLIYGQNVLTFYFNLAHRFEDPCHPEIPVDVVSQIYPDSMLDMTETQHMVGLPDLAPFAAAGFPFTVRADLSRTALLLPETPSYRLLSSAFDVMAGLSESTGVAGSRLSVALGPAELGSIQDRHWLAFAPLDDPLARRLLAPPYSVAGGRLRVTAPSRFEQLKVWSLHGISLDREAADRALSSRAHINALVASPVPLNRDRQLVLFTSSGPGGVSELAMLTEEVAARGALNDDLALVDSDGQVRTFRLQPGELAGDNDALTQLRWTLGQRPMAMLLLMLFILTALAAGAYPLLRRREQRRLAHRRPSPPAHERDNE